MKLNLKDNKAITLISLVVTIIVLLILAGISISMLAGDNSILQKATEAKTNTDNAQAREELQLAISGAGVDYHSGKVQNTSQTFRDYIFSSDGQTSINNELPENATFNSSSNEITYKRITFVVADDGTLSISNSITVLNSDVFSGCYGLSGMDDFSSNLTEIGDGAFKGCILLNKKIVFPTSEEGGSFRYYRA